MLQADRATLLPTSSSSSPSSAASPRDRSHSSNSSNSSSSSSSSSSGDRMAVVTRVRSDSTTATDLESSIRGGKPLGIMETERLLHVAHPAAPLSPESAKRSIAYQLSNLTVQLDSLPRPTKFALLVTGLFFFFGLHNFLQERIMHFEGFEYGMFLGFLEVLGVTVFSHMERVMNGEAGIRRAPLKSYVATTLCLLGSSALSNQALNWVTYPIKVVVRSCKLIPTMVISGIINKRRFTFVEYLAAVAVCLGLIFFGLADFSVSPTFSFLGLLLLFFSIVCDSILPNVQEKLFAAGSSRLEVTFWSNVFTLGAMTVSMLISGDLVGAVTYAAGNRQAALYMCIYTLLAYVAISLHMTMVKQFGSVAAVLVGNARKSMTIVLSFLFFPKPFSPLYVLGGGLVFGGLTVSAYIKSKSPKGGAGAGSSAAGSGGQVPLSSKA